MNILITGSSGLIGTALHNSLTKEGHILYVMKRGPYADSPFNWQPDENQISFDESIKIDAVINLAGSNISDGRWTKAKKKIIFDSRINSTTLLSNHFAKLNAPPKVFISASAIGFYGDTGEEQVDEKNIAGSDFLAHVAQKWEAATQPAVAAGIRTINLRTGIVLSPHGGALKQMLPPFKLGLGGVIGNGKQYMSWVSLPEVCRIIEFILTTESLNGPLNMVSPSALTNYKFTRCLGKALSRPTLFPMPAIVAKLIFGEMADALLLSSIRVKPEKLLNSGYKFINNDLSETPNMLLHN